MKILLLIIFIFSKVFCQYDVYNLNNYNYLQDSLKVNKSIPMLKSFLLPGWGQLSKKDPLWKPILFFGIESIAIATNYHHTKKSNDFRDDFENYADLHWDLELWYENTKMIFPDRWSDIIIGTHKLGLKINGNYFYSSDLENLSKQYSWSDIKVLRDRDFYENIGKYDQFVGGWDDEFDDPFDDEGNWYSQKKEGVESVILTKKKNYYRDLRHKSNISSHYARYAISILMLNHFTSGLDALSTSSKKNFRIGNLSMRLLPYSAYNEGGVLFNISW